MKVVFKITQAQELIALAIANASRLNAIKLDEECNWDMVRCGSFFINETGFGARQQNLTIGEGTLTYEGGRTTLGAGELCALSIIEKIFGSIEAATGAVVEVTSTAPHLQWYETEQDGLQRADLDRIILVCNQNNTCAFHAAITLLREKYGKMLDMSHAKLSAQYNSVELKDFYKARKVLCNQ